MDCETRKFYQGETEVNAQVSSNLCYCDDTGAWRDEVLLKTQGGRKTTASRIGRHDGRLWNLPFPEGMEIARFHSDDQPAIFVVPNDERNLNNCVRLKLYRKSQMKHCPGVTFDLTKNKDLICALPYATYGMDALWSFLFAFQDASGNLHWVASKETFKLGKNDVASSRKRESATAAPRRTSVRKASRAPTPSSTNNFYTVKSEPTETAMLTQPSQCFNNANVSSQAFSNELQAGMFVNHMSGISATIVAVNQGFALVEMSDGSGTRQCLVSELSPVQSLATAPLSHTSNLNSINAIPAQFEYEPAYPQQPQMTQQQQQNMAYEAHGLADGMDLFADSALPSAGYDAPTDFFSPELFTLDAPDGSLGFEMDSSALPSFFDEQYS